jgi:hypothetical protein
MRAVAVVQAGGVDARTEYEPTGVHQDVAFASEQALGSVVASLGVPHPVPLSAWLSITAALGSASRSPLSRTASRSRS